MSMPGFAAESSLAQHAAFSHYNVIAPDAPKLDYVERGVVIPQDYCDVVSDLAGAVCLGSRRCRKIVRAVLGC